MWVETSAEGGHGADPGALACYDSAARVEELVEALAKEQGPAERKVRFTLSRLLADPA